MATVFTMIIRGELPGRFLWRDDICAAFLSINPIRPGHALVVPIVEVDHWIDLDPAVVTHATAVAHHIGRAQQAAFTPQRVGLMIAGFEVPHTHLHVIPVEGMADLDFANALADPGADALDDAHAKLLGALRADGHPEVPEA